MFKTRYAQDESIPVLVRIMTILEQNREVVGYDDIAEGFNLEESVVAIMVFDAVVNIFVEGKRGSMDIQEAAVIYNIPYGDLFKRLVNLALDKDVMKDKSTEKKCQCLNINLSSFYRYKKRSDAGDEIFPQIGRPGYLSHDGGVELENRFSLKTNKVKHEENDIRKQVMIIKKEEEEGKGILAKIPQPSRFQPGFQMNRLLNAHFPESDANPTITNENRERKLNDPINAINNVIMTSAVLHPQHGCNVGSDKKYGTFSRSYGTYRRLVLQPV